MEMTFEKVKWKSVNKFAHTIQDKCWLSLSRLNEFLLNYNIFYDYGLALVFWPVFFPFDVDCQRVYKHPHIHIYIYIYRSHHTNEPFNDTIELNRRTHHFTTDIFLLFILIMLISFLAFQKCSTLRRTLRYPLPWLTMEIIKKQSTIFSVPQRLNIFTKYIDKEQKKK